MPRVSLGCLEFVEQSGLAEVSWERLKWIGMPNKRVERVEAACPSCPYLHVHWT